MSDDKDALLSERTGERERCEFGCADIGDHYPGCPVHAPAPEPERSKMVGIVSHPTLTDIVFALQDRGLAPIADSKDDRPGVWLDKGDVSRLLAEPEPAAPTNDVLADVDSVGAEPERGAIGREITTSVPAECERCGRPCEQCAKPERGEGALKSCPFCGSDAKYEHYRKLKSAKCQNVRCGAEIGFQDAHKREVVAAWNCRGDDALVPHDFSEYGAADVTAALDGYWPDGGSYSPPIDEECFIVTAGALRSLAASPEPAGREPDAWANEATVEAVLKDRLLMGGVLMHSDWREYATVPVYFATPPAPAGEDLTLTVACKVCGAARSTLIQLGTMDPEPLLGWTFTSGIGWLCPQHPPTMPAGEAALEEAARELWTLTESMAHGTLREAILRIVRRMDRATDAAPQDATGEEVD